MGLSNLSFSATNVKKGAYADAPVSCMPGDIYICTDGDGVNIPNELICQSTDVWTPSLPKNTCRINAGVYVGDGTVNRAIPHGLSEKPTIIFIFAVGGNVTCQIIDQPEIHYQAGGGEIGVLPVTIPDTDNFYVGGGTTLINRMYSGNHKDGVWSWVAFA